MRYIPFLLAGMFITGYAFGQRVSNVKASLDGSNVKISFDLEGVSPSDLFEVKLFSSEDNFSEPLKMVTGGVGKGVKPGNGIEITWNAQDELQNFKGDITFEVRASVMGGYYTVTNPTSSSKFKKGKLMPINWQGGDPGEKVKIELMSLNQTAATISENVGNQGSYIWTIPKNIKPARSYQIRISNTSDVDSQGLSKMFAIKGKTPVAFILIPVAIGAGVAAYIFTKPGSGPESNPGGGGGDKVLPTPPNPN